MGRKRNVALARVWKQRIAEQRRGALSITDFCRQEGFSAKSFYVWRKRLRERATFQRSHLVDFRGRSGAAGEAGALRNSALFVPVELPSAAVGRGGLRMELPSGAVLTLPVDASLELVVTVLRTVMNGAAAAEAQSC